MSDDRRAIGLALAAYAFAATMVGTTLPTPLYGLYRARFGFSELMITVIFATYAVGVIAALVLFGRMSDVVGRRAVLLPGLACSALSAGVLPAGRRARLAARRPGAVRAVGRHLHRHGDRDPRRSGAAGGPGASNARRHRGEHGRPRAAGRCSPGSSQRDSARRCARCSGSTSRWSRWRRSASCCCPRRWPNADGPACCPRRSGVPPELRGAFVRAALAGFAGFAVLGLFTGVSPAFLTSELGVHSRAIVGPGRRRGVRRLGGRPGSPWAASGPSGRCSPAARC